MTTTTAAALATTATSAAQNRRRARSASVAGAVLATSALYLAGRAAGVTFALTDPGKTQVLDLALYQIAMFAAFFAVTGWGALAVLERYTRRARAIWSTLAGSVLLLSFAPIAMESASASTKAMLVAIHVTVAVAVFPMARRGR